MSRTYLKVTEALPAKGRSDFYEKIATSPATSIGIKQYFLKSFRNIPNSIKKNWIRYLIPIVILSVLYLWLKTSKVEWIFYRTFFQDLQYALIYLLAVWADFLPRAIYYTLFVFSIRIFKGFSLKKFITYTIGGYKNLFSSLSDQHIVTEFILGLSAGSILGALVTDYKVKGFAASAFIIIALLHRLSIRYHFTFLKALTSDLKKKVRFSFSPNFQANLILGVNLGLLASIFTSYLSRSLLIRAIPGLILLVVSLLFLKKVIKDDYS